MKAAILAFLMWLGWFVPPQAVVVSGYDPGGSVETYILFWDRIEKSGVPIIIDGACVSACTFVTSEIDPSRVCVTPRASLGVHLATVDGKPDRDTTALLQVTFYPAWLQMWIAAWEAENGPLTQDVVYIRYDELKKHYRTCTQSEAPIAGDAGDA